MRAADHTRRWERPQTPAKGRKASPGAHPLQRETLQDPPHEAVADLAIGVQAHLAAAFDEGGVEGVPELDLACHMPGHLDRPVLGLGRERDDQVEAVVLQHLEAARSVLGDIDAHLLHHRHREGIDLAGADADRLHIDPRAVEMLQQGLGHRRADGVAGAGEEHGIGEPGHGLNPGYAGRRAA